MGLTNTSMVMSNLESRHKHQFNLGLPGRATWIVNERGLYELLLQSRKPEAREFKRWVTCTVLPTIRKGGAYVMGEEKVTTRAVRGGTGRTK
ncbi:hypothetical protein Q427_08200 [Halomonas sp. BC04]|nr:hypothetical protein Q427_08200 [Halomonas sp. BC04]